MMFKEGIWRVYRFYPRGDEVQQRLVARFVLVGDRVEYLEDHDGVMEEVLPEGRLTDQGLARLTMMSHSPYWHVVHEDDVASGEHEELLPELEDD